MCVGLPGPQFPVCFHCRESPVLGISIPYTHCCVCRSTRSPVSSVFQVNHCESPVLGIYLIHIAVCVGLPGPQFPVCFHCRESPVLGISIPYTHCCVCRSTRSPVSSVFQVNHCESPVLGIYLIHIVVCVGLPGPQFPVCFHCRESPVLGISIPYTHCRVCRSTRSPVSSVFPLS